MTQSASNSGNIAITVLPQWTGGCVCEITASLAGQSGQTQRFHGQNPNHAIAIALEGLACTFRREAEAEQHIDWEAVDRSPDGRVIEKRYHVILHYERIANDQSKFEAMNDTLMGNTVVENAEIVVIQIDSELPIKPVKRKNPETV